MATLTWTGTTSTAWSTSTNWNPNSAAGGPGTTDNCYVDGSVTVNIASTGDETGILSLHVASSYTGTIGESGSPLDLVTCRQINFSGQGDAYFKAVMAGTSDDVTVRTSSMAANAVNIDSTGTINRVNILQGRANVQGGTISTLNNGHVGGRMGDTQCTVESGVTAVSATNLISGRISSAQTLAGTVNVNGGVLEITDSAGLNGGTSILNLNGGTLVAKGTSTYTLLNVFSGKADFTGDGRAKTVTNMNVYTGGVVDLRNGSNSITMSNNPIVFGDGRVLATGQTLTLKVK